MRAYEAISVSSKATKRLNISPVTKLRLIPDWRRKKRGVEKISSVLKSQRQAKKTRLLTDSRSAAKGSAIRTMPYGASQPPMEVDSIPLSIVLKSKVVLATIWRINNSARVLCSLPRGVKEKIEASSGMSRGKSINVSKLIKLYPPS